MREVPINCQERRKIPFGREESGFREEVTEEPDLESQEEELSRQKKEQI